MIRLTDNKGRWPTFAESLERAIASTRQREQMARLSRLRLRALRERIKTQNDGEHYGPLFDYRKVLIGWA